MLAMLEPIMLPTASPGAPFNAASMEVTSSGAEGAETDR